MKWCNADWTKLRFEEGSIYFKTNVKNSLYHYFNFNDVSCSSRDFFTLIPYQCDFSALCCNFLPALRYVFIFLRSFVNNNTSNVRSFGVVRFPQTINLLLSWCSTLFDLKDENMVTMKMLQNKWCNNDIKWRWTWNVGLLVMYSWRFLGTWSLGVFWRYYVW
jgi:hypothetical protein